MDRLDKIMQIAEELSHTRSQVDNTMVNLKTQLRYLSNMIDQTIAELETRGVDAELLKIVDIEERAAGISRSVKTIKQQSASLEQALGYIKAAKRLSN
jgi:predicted  nucleic acid-binding Zn-ribbon protein